MKEEIEQILAEVRDLKCKTEKDIEEARVRLLGKKGEITKLFEEFRTVAPELKKEFGQKLNVLKKEATAKIEELKAAAESAGSAASDSFDATMPGDPVALGTRHPVSIARQQIVNIFRKFGYDVAEGPEIEDDYHVFEALNFPPNHPARDMQDTFYIDENTLMRTHTSPVQAHVMLEAKGKGPIKVICPGKTYRRDDDDATHSHQFMQCEGLVIDKNITMGDLKGTLDVFAKKMFGEKREIRLRPSYFPFTEPSVEVDISCGNCGGKGCAMCKGTGWIEVLGAGMVNPHVLEMCGFDPKEYQGFAFGIGLERVAMLKYDIDNIRDFYNNDLRFLEQFERKE